MAGEPTTTATRLRPDRDLIGRLLASGGEDLRQCMQCATCSAVCELTDARRPGPRKEMLWAQWGLRDRLLRDPDVWLCHACGDCTAHCPRGARPGDVMAALRREHIAYYSGARFARWSNRPASLPWLVLVPLAVLVAAAAVWQWSGLAAVELSLGGTRFVIPFWTRLPQWLLGSLLVLLVGLDVLVLVRGGRSFLRTLDAAAPAESSPRAGGNWAKVVRRISLHDDFGRCGASRARGTHHLLVVCGMLGLALTSAWVVTARWNPLLDGLVYPLGLWNPWKLLANLSGASVGAGTVLMLVARWRARRRERVGAYPDLLVLGYLLVVVLTGFAAELLHLARLDALRHGFYAMHLTAVLGLLWLLPYSKLAHIVYRTVALVHAERIRRGPR